MSANWRARLYRLFGLVMVLVPNSWYEIQPAVWAKFAVLALCLLLAEITQLDRKPE